jgi:nitroreductase
MLTAEALLALMRGRRSRRQFAPKVVSREDLAPLFEAARSAPSATNRQPWKFRVLLSTERKAALVAVVRAKVEALRAVLVGSAYEREFLAYSDFFYEPLEAAPAVILPLWRPFPDTLAALVTRAGQEAAPFTLSAHMPSEVCATSAAVMNLLLMGEAQGLACCWMAGPMLAAEELSAWLKLSSPWRALGAIAVGHPVEGEAPRAPERKTLEKIVEWE